MTRQMIVARWSTLRLATEKQNKIAFLTNTDNWYKANYYGWDYINGVATSIPVIEREIDYRLNGELVPSGD